MGVPTGTGEPIGTSEPLVVFFLSDIRQAIVAGVVLAVETAQANGGANGEHMAGILSMAKHQALRFGVPWPFIINDARLALGGDVGGLLGRGCF